MKQAEVDCCYPTLARSVVEMKGSPKHEAEVASFLLQLKHRSPTPPYAGDDTKSSTAIVSSYNHHQPPPTTSLSSSHRPPEKSKGSYHSYRYQTSHQTSPSTERPPSSSPAVNRISNGNTLSTLTGDWESLLGSSSIVLMKDKNLVPDALFVAMAQMKPCRLSLADRVGCYKSRPLGYIGLCCKHCGGQPGFGRFFPNSVRSLAQTTTSQTILKHVTHKCRFCPREIRDAVLEYQRLLIAENSSVGRPRYGSRKIFFQRIWSRLHHDCPIVDEEEDSSSSSAKVTLDDSVSHETPSDLDEESLATYSGDNHFDNDGEMKGGKRKNSFSSSMGGKRVKVTSPIHRLTAD